MNEPQQNLPAASGLEELRNDVSALRAMISVTLILLIILGLCADVFLERQVSGLGTQLAQNQQTVNSFNMAGAAEFCRQLNDYARTHPDFTPIFEKYKGFISQGAAASMTNAAFKRK